MHALILALASVTLALGGAAVILVADRRAAALPRPGDAQVTGVSVQRDFPAEGTTTVAVAVANPGTTPVLVGLSPRGRGLPGRGKRTTTPYRTTLRRYRADQHATIGVVAPGSVSRLPVLIAAGSWCRIVIVVGQPDGRLHVTSVPVTGKPTVSASPGAGLLRPSWTRSPLRWGTRHPDPHHG